MDESTKNMGNDNVNSHREPSEKLKTSWKKLGINIKFLIFLGILILATLFFSLNKNTSIMTLEEIAQYKQRLRTIQQNPDKDQRYDALIELAKEVGASTEDTKTVGFTSTPLSNGMAVKTHRDQITESGLTQNINDALQTATMIFMCDNAAKNYRIAILATIASIVSACSAWIAIQKDKIP